jgi:hypothetical protein
MRLTLPRAFAHIIAWGIAACSHPEPPPPPGPPISAEPEVQVGSADDECKGLETALETYGKCPNLDDEDRAWVKAIVEYSEQTFTAGKKATIPDPALHAMAHACRKAAVSVHFATVRCEAGPKPHPDW